MSQRELKIQVYFKTALYISSNNEPDVLRLVFNDEFMFVSIDNLPIEFSQREGRMLQDANVHSKLVLERIIPP